MSGLLTLWSVSLFVAAAALLTMLVLLLGRVVSGRIQQVREQQRRRLVPMLLGAVPAAGLGWSGRGSLITDVSVELIRLVRGSDRDRFIEAATQFGVPARLRHRLGSGSPRVRLSAAEALAEFPDERSVESLHAALRDRNAEVRLSAALALVGIRRAPPAAELVEVLGIGTREHSLLVNGLMREIAQYDPDAVKALVLAPETPAAAKLPAIQALAASGDYSLVPIVADLVRTASADDPALPLYFLALGTFAHPAAAEAVESGLASPVAEVRAAAAEATGRIGLVALAPLLAELLGDQAFWVRFRAGEALARLDETGAALLRDRAAHAEEPARSAATVTLAERGLS